MVDWTSISNEILINPRMPKPEQQKLMEALQGIGELHAHVWLATSGSSGVLKWVALSKQAILASAKAVNEHLESDASDIWFNPLPIFHVGGLGIWARSWLSGASVIAFESNNQGWDPKLFTQQIMLNQASLTALVPAQVFDLVSQQIPSPFSLRAVIVGGGALSENIYMQAIRLGWPLLPSYGLTECASQVATALLDSNEMRQYPTLKPLKHVKIELDERGFLKIKSPALLTGYAFINEQGCQWIDPKVDGWLITEDRVVIEDGQLKHISRSENFIKIGGESVDLLRLEKILDEILPPLSQQCEAVLLAMPDNRLGYTIQLAVVCERQFVCQNLVEQFNQAVFPFERIREVHYVTHIPRSPLRKVLKAELMKQIIK